MNAAFDRQPWMDAPATLAVLDALEARGGPGSARFVGGCVRNAVLGRPVDDIDIATTLTPGQVAGALKASGLAAHPTGVEHGTITAVAGGRPFEVTTLRRDVETDGRRAVVAFTTDWEEDAARRDFTLNALYLDRAGAIFDPTGLGLADAAAGRIRFVGEAEARIREDYLRILRFFRFSAWYGRGEPDAAAVAACAALKAGVATLAAERISKELLKLLAAEDPRGATAAMAGAGVLDLILPAPPDLDRLDGLVALDRQEGWAGDALLRLAAMSPDEAQAAAATATRLRLANAQRDRLEAALGDGPAVTAGMDARAARQALHALGAAVFLDRAKLAWAWAPKAQAPQWRALLEIAVGWTPPCFPFTGEDVVAAGVPRGPLVGEALRAVEAWWIDNDFADDRAAAAEVLRAVARRIVP